MEEKSEKSREGRGENKRQVTRNGRKLLEALEEVLIIWNENVKGDRKREYTYVGERRCSVIDYIIGEEEALNKMRKVQVEDRIDRVGLLSNSGGNRRKEKEKR